jgi:hypothetical protein
VLPNSERAPVEQGFAELNYRRVTVALRPHESGHRATVYERLAPTPR